MNIASHVNDNQSVLSFSNESPPDSFFDSRDSCNERSFSRLIVLDQKCFSENSKTTKVVLKILVLTGVFAAANPTK